MQYKTKSNKTAEHLISAPFIYWMIVPSIFLDISMELYHQVCFRLYGIELVKRGEYIKIDRQKLSYLTGMEKLNCMYCGYVNGLFAYAVEVAGRTEAYWCGIKHQPRKDFRIPAHQQKFLEYGDEKAYRSIQRY